LQVICRLREVAAFLALDCERQKLPDVCLSHTCLSSSRTLICTPTAPRLIPGGWIAGSEPYSIPPRPVW
jgi:hypothetical protein